MLRRIRNISTDVLTAYFAAFAFASAWTFVKSRINKSNTSL